MKKSLIEVAQELVDAKEANDAAKERAESAWAEARACGFFGITEAEAFIAGYDARCTEEANPSPTFADLLTRASSADHALTLANQRIAELEAQLAARPDVQGVVVDEEMCRRFAYVYWERESWNSASPGARIAVRNALTAALTSATIVPLASAVPLTDEVLGDLYRPALGVRDE